MEVTSYAPPELVLTPERRSLTQTDFADACYHQAPDGFQFLYSTQVSKHIPIQKALITENGNVRPTRHSALLYRADWVNPESNDQGWAPEVFSRDTQLLRRNPNTYEKIIKALPPQVRDQVRQIIKYCSYYDVMLYCAASQEAKGMGIGTAIGYHGRFFPLEHSLVAATDWSEIDPAVDKTHENDIQSPIKVTWGSMFQPLKQRLLEPNGLYFAEDSPTETIAHPDPHSTDHRMLEAANPVTFHGVKSLLVSSNGWLPKDTYMISQMRWNGKMYVFDPQDQPVVDARAKPETGLEADPYWINPGHSDVVYKRDRNGNERLFLVYSAIPRELAHIQFPHRYLLACELEMNSQGSLQAKGGPRPSDNALAYFPMADTILPHPQTRLAA